jgi:hypothetical protein
VQLVQVQAAAQVAQVLVLRLQVQRLHAAVVVVVLDTAVPAVVVVPQAALAVVVQVRQVLQLLAQAELLIQAAVVVAVLHPTQTFQAAAQVVQVL